MLTAFFLICIHYIADFIFQSSKMALGKSKNIKDLLHHTFVYSSIWSIPIIFLFPKDWSCDQYIYGSLLFCSITFIAHTITDYFTSRIVHKSFANKMQDRSILNFGPFSMIGFDQVLHYTQLFLTFNYIIHL